jgi:hypothetical protein
MISSDRRPTGRRMENRGLRRHIQDRNQLRLITVAYVVPTSLLHSKNIFAKILINI